MCRSRAYARLFGARYPDRGEGDALVLRAGETVVVMNTKRNAGVSERFSVKLAGPAERLSGALEPHHYLVAQRVGSSLWLQANTYPDRATELALQCARRLALSVTTAEALVNSRWDEAAHVPHVRLSHERGAVELVAERGAGPGG